MESFLQQSPEARSELTHVRSDLALLALSVEEQEPPASARNRFMKQVARERRVPAAPDLAVMPLPVADPILSKKTAAKDPKEHPQTDAPLPFRPRERDVPQRQSGFFGTVAPWLGWAVAAGLAVTTWDFYRKTDMLTNEVVTAHAESARAIASSARAQAVLDTIRSPSAQRFLLTRQNTQPIASARVTYLADNGSLVFQGNNLEPLPPYKTYELWLIPAGAGRQPIAAGTFKPDERGFASLILPEMPKGVIAGSFGVTMEDDGGAQAPTLPILMIGS